MNAALCQRRGLAGKRGVPGPQPVRDENVFHGTIADFPVAHYHNAERISKTDSVETGTIPCASQGA